VKAPLVCTLECGLVLPGRSTVPTFFLWDISDESGFRSFHLGDKFPSTTPFSYQKIETIFFPADGMIFNFLRLEDVI